MTPDDYDDLESLPIERQSYDYELPRRRQPMPPEPEPDEDDSGAHEPVLYRGTGSDPMFGYLLAIALSVGLMPLVPYNADLRYTIAWGVLALFGVLSWLFGTTTRIGRENAGNLAWGGVFGLIVAAPLMLIGGGTLTTTVRMMFQTGIGDQVVNLPPGVVLAYLIFVMPLAETLFFRGFMQQNRPFALVGLLSSVWAIILFIPLLNVGEFPLIAVIICIVLVVINMVYAYVRDRNGLASAWVCQIVVSFVLLFLPYFTP